jgi:hypothetical protein
MEEKVKLEKVQALQLFKQKEKTDQAKKVCYHYNRLSIAMHNIYFKFYMLFLVALSEFHRENSQA